MAEATSPYKTFERDQNVVQGLGIRCEGDDVIPVIQARKLEGYQCGAWFLFLIGYRPQNVCCPAS